MFRKDKVCIWNQSDGLKDLIECNKEGNLVGKASHCELYQPIGICGEFNNAVYVADYRSSYIQITSTVIHNATFLCAELMRTFSIHEKKARCFSYSGRDKRQVVFKSNDRLFSNLIIFSYVWNCDSFIGLYFPTSNELFTLKFPLRCCLFWNVQIRKINVVNDFFVGAYDLKFSTWRIISSIIVIKSIMLNLICGLETDIRILRLQSLQRFQEHKDLYQQNLPFCCN